VTSSQRLSLPRYRGEIADVYAGPETVAALSDIRSLLAGPGAEVLFEGRNTVVAIPLPRGPGRAANVVIKDFHSRGVNQFKTLVRASKAARAWRGARALVDAKFETPFPVAFLERRHRGFVAESYFVAERVRGAREIRELFQTLSSEKLEPVLSALARELAAVHARGILHRDLSDGNILVLEDRGAPRFLFLDTNRVRVLRTVGPMTRARNLVRLGIPPALRHAFLERYAEARGRPLRKSFVFWYNVSKATFTAWARLKKTLRLRKISRTLKIQ
jgi:hypothetical protein